MTEQQIAKLRPRARIIRTIGDQLISGPEAAVIELVKNAYDADSTSVSLRISPGVTGSSSGEIEVADTGHGMTPEIVIHRWFEPATDDKLKRGISPGGRVMLGAKGIGRFAAARLGLTAALTSVAFLENGDLVETSLSIDWRKFEEDTYLDQVEVPVTIKELSDSPSTPTGVHLRISSLRDTWTKKKLESLVRELRRVALPTNDTSKPFAIRVDLSDFKRENVGFDGLTVFSELNKDINASEQLDADPFLVQPFRVSEQADYKLVGLFSEDGGFEGTFRIVRGDGKEQSLVIPAPPLTPDEMGCGAVYVELNIFDREPEAIADLFRRMGLNFEEIGIRAARKILTESAGIGIFRSGFRIRPYGDPENDWLELERQRVQNPSRKLGLSQLSGKVVINSADLSGLLERSSREGLEHNSSFERLKTLIATLLVHVEDKRLAFREKAGMSRRAIADVESVKTLAALPSVSEAIDKTPEPHRSPLRDAARKDSTAIAASLDEIDAYQRLLQSRAALGLVVAQIIHEGRRVLNPMAATTKSISEISDQLLDDGTLGILARKHLPEQLSIILESAKQLSRLFKRLDPISGRKRGRPKAFDLSEIINSALSLFKDAIESARVEVYVEGDSKVYAYGYPEDYQSALMNIVENAIHWLGNSTRTPRTLKIHVAKEGDMTRTYISNNGPEIDDANISRLFQAGFSLRTEGTGLGLAIARQACHSSNGDINYLEHKDETTFVIDFPNKGSD